MPQRSPHTDLFAASGLLPALQHRLLCNLPLQFKLIAENNSIEFSFSCSTHEMSQATYVLHGMLPCSACQKLQLFFNMTNFGAHFQTCMTESIGFCLHQTYCGNSSNTSSCSGICSFISKLPSETLIIFWQNPYHVSFHPPILQAAPGAHHRHHPVQLRPPCEDWDPSWCNRCNSQLICQVFDKGE